MKSVSVITPNFNNAKWLPQCLESCLKQKYLKEIIIVDDHSTDRSWEILKNYSRKFPKKIKVFKNPGKGANAARNFGLDQSLGDYIQWLDSDDFLLPGKFQVQTKALEKTGSDIAYSDFRFDFYESGDFMRTEKKEVSTYDDFTEEILKDNWIASHSYLLTRTIAEKIKSLNVWNPSTKIAQDREYFTMAALIGAKFQYVPGTYAVYNRWSSDTISGMDFSKRIELTQVLESKFRSTITESYLDKSQKKKYLKIINTHKIKACYYNPKIELDYTFSPLEIKWSLIHYKMRLLIPFIYFKKHINFFVHKFLPAKDK